MSAIKNISLYIPHVFPNFDRAYIENVFIKYGEINHIDLVAKYDRNEKAYNAVYVHFNKWHNTKTNVDFQNKLLSGETRVYHDDPWYWIVLPNNTKKHIPGERKQKIDLNGSNAISAPKTPRLETPEKPIRKMECPGAPMKSRKSYAEVATISSEHNLNDEFDSYVERLCNEPVEEWSTAHFDIAACEKYTEKDETQMAEIEAEMDAEDTNLVFIDSRYIATLEEENMWFRYEIARLQTTIQTIMQFKVTSDKEMVRTASKDKSE